MARERLETARDLLRRASESADGEAADRLDGFADQLDALATRERGPDHGRLDRILAALSDIADGANAETASAVKEARSEITEFRKGVEGV